MKIIFGMMLTMLLIGMLAVKANPVYPGELTMTMEDIVVTISKVYGKVWAEVNGIYNFSVVFPHPPGYSPAVMSYPVPSDAEAVSAAIDETPLNWTYAGAYYQTVVGNFPFITWLSPVPNVFSIKTHYEHPAYRNCTFLYALGTGSYLAEPKWCWAYITVFISKDIAPTGDDIDVYLVTKEGVTEPASYSITSLNGMWDVTYAAEAGWRDFLLTIKPLPQPPAANFTWSPSIPEVGESVIFDASSSSPGWNGTKEMPIVEYRWDFSDGNRTTTSSPTVYHSFSSSGIYYVTLTVSARSEGLADSTLAAGPIKVRILGDPNGDGVFDIKDILLCAKSFGSVEGEPLYNADADMNRDGTVDIKRHFHSCKTLWNMRSLIPLFSSTTRSPTSNIAMLTIPKLVTMLAPREPWPSAD